MKILIIGDIYGEAGKNAIKNNLHSIKEEFKPDIIIANGENVSIGGKSLTQKDYLELMKCGIEYFTMGNHTFRNKDFENYVGYVNNIVRPGNFEKNKPGVGHIVIEINDKKLLLFNMLGRSFMPGHEIENPFLHAEEILDSVEHDIALLDFHCEATAEKIILANYLNDRVAIFWGTHTHIQTADERILNGKTAYITDVGMTGVFDSAIGADFKNVTERMKNGTPGKFIEAKGPVRINGIVVTLSDKELKPIKIERVSIDA